MKHKHIEGKGKPLKVVAPRSFCNLIKGKEYLVTQTDEFRNNSYGWGFYLYSETGNEIVALEIGCAHLNGGNWIVTEREPE